VPARCARHTDLSPQREPTYRYADSTRRSDPAPSGKRDMDPDALRARRRAIRRGLVRTVLLLTGVTAVFLLVPWKAVNLGDTLLITAVFFIGLAGAAALIVWQVIAYRDAKMSGSARLQGLLVALYVAVLFFALSYYLLAISNPEAIAGLETRLDALYFSLTIVSTVGFGDVHAVDQAARAIVSFQLVFDLIFVSLAVAAARAAGPPTVAAEG
jgi:voltage-gated potassium channel